MDAKQAGAATGDVHEMIKFLTDKDNFPSGKAEVLALGDAPTMDDFREGARSAPP